MWEYAIVVSDAAFGAPVIKYSEFPGEPNRHYQNETETSFLNRMRDEDWEILDISEPMGEKRTLTAIRLRRNTAQNS